MLKLPLAYSGYIATALAVLLILAAVACGGEQTPAPSLFIVPPPTATPVPTVDTSAPEPTESMSAPTETSAPSSETPAYPVPPSPLNDDDLGHLPDDPTELMNAVFDHSLAQVGRKMAYSHNEAFIPVILEFMRFQSDEESRLTLASFMVRIRDRIPEGEFSIVPPGQDGWGWWVEWLSQNPEVSAPDGYDGWKGRLFSIIDAPMGEFMYPGVPSTIRLEEIIWGGVPRDGIPDLRFPPNLTPEEASYLEAGDRVFGVAINGEHRAYPLRVLNAHEMANDIVGGVQFALAY